MRLFVVALALAFACSVAAPLRAAATAPLFTFDDFQKIVRLSDPQVSPDGRRVAVVESRTDIAGDQTQTAIVLVDIATGEMRTLTQGRDHAAMPRWSPDGSRLAFVTLPSCPSQPCAQDKPQVFAFPMDGGDPEQLTHAANGVQSYAWRPDGRAIAYVTSDDAPNKADIAKHHDLFVVGDQDFLSQAAPVAAHLWLQILGGDAQRITSGTTSLGDGAFSSDLSWSPDGTRIAFERLPDAYFAHLGHTRSCVVTLGSKDVECLGDGYSDDVSFSPVGDALYYSGAHDGYWSIQLDALVRAGAQGRRIAADLDRDISWATWAHNGDGLWLAASDRATVGLWYAPLHGALRRIDLGDVVFGRLGGSAAPDGGFAFVGATSDDPSELYYLAAGASTPRRLTGVNAWLAQYTVAKTREFTWTNDGFDEDGALTYPAQYVPGHQYPLVLVIHGGPTEASSNVGFSAFGQVLAAHGYFVFQPNYRGSDNLGFAYGKALVGDVDAGPGRDIVAGVKALEATGMIDASRIGVSGWSGGGLLTSWLIGHYTIWKAAVSGAAVDDFVEEYDLTDVFDYLPSLMGGISPWQGNGRAAYVASSPITYVANVTAPTLILSDTGDYRVPTVQAYEFYHALRENGKTVEFVAIPAYGHFPSDPVHQIDVYKRWTDWMDRYLH